MRGDDAAKARAVSLLDAATGAKFTSVRLWERAAALYSQLGQPPKAAAIYQRLLTEASSSGEQDALREQLADIYLQSEDKTNALKQLQAIVHDDPTRFPNAWFALGEIAEQDGNYSDAVDDLQNAIRGKPNIEPAYYDLAIALANLHRSDEALKVLTDARAQFNNNFRCEFYSGLIYRGLKNYPEAIHHFTAAETVAKATATRFA